MLLTVTQNPVPVETVPTAVEVAADRTMSASTLARLELSVPVEIQRAYTGDWQRFAAWCTENDRSALPATAETLAGYCGHRADKGRAPRQSNGP